MKIALDAMGGDRAPQEIINGAIQAVKEAAGRFDVILVGDRVLIEKHLSSAGGSFEHIEIVHAPEVIGMSESPATALRRKKNSSISVATGLVKEGLAQGFLSAGNTGAAVASSLFSYGRIPGFSRPAIAIHFPTRNGGTIFLDGGANSDCTPKHLYQFALMGSIYAENILKRNNPKVGLLSIGEESSKGNELAREAHKLLEKSSVNFIGNVEGHDIFRDSVDVVVTDGFTGNVVLKFTESIIDYMNGLIKESVSENLLAKLGALLMRPAFLRIKRRLDYSEYGGMPLLGVDGVTIIGHGGSNAKAIKNALFAVEDFYRIGMNLKMKNSMEADRQ
ncbi:MAG: phosphate acyltransferase PlsX [Candidatus Krumholzibacteriota bacterium]|nr:phosphate acyltransferase PlsX [Candidatus Krumholzibacteriota bacterium]